TTAAAGRPGTARRRETARSAYSIAGWARRGWASSAAAGRTPPGRAGAGRGATGGRRTARLRTLPARPARPEHGDPLAARDELPRAGAVRLAEVGQALHEGDAVGDLVVV